MTWLARFLQSRRPWVRARWARALYRTPLLAAARRARRRTEGTTVLLYHGVGDPGVMPRALFVTPEDLDRHLAYLKAHYTLVSLGEILRRLRAGAPLPTNGIALTFDDGYRSVHSHAAPLLLRRGVPATVFACTGPADTGTPLWVTQVFYGCAVTRADALRIGAGSQLPEVRTRSLHETSLPLGTRAERERAALWLVAALRRAGPREDLLERVAAALAVPPGAGPSAQTPMLAWAEIENLHRQGIEVGGHTASHPSLVAIPRAAAWRELVASRAALEAHLGTPVSAFAYPFGDRDPLVEQFVQEAGYRGAWTAPEGCGAPSGRPYGLARQAVGNWPVELLALDLAGL